MIELTKGQRIEMIPAATLVIGRVNTTIDTDDHMTTISWIDPQRMTIRMNASTKIRIEGQSAIGRFEL